MVLEKGALPDRPRKLIQDMPPPGGYPQFRTAGRYPVRGPSGAVIWMLGIGTVFFGVFNAMRMNHRRTLLKEEEHSARIAIAPFLQAVEDARYVHAYKQMLERERDVMKDVPRWQFGKSLMNSKKHWVNQFGREGLML